MHACACAHPHAPMHTCARRHASCTHTHTHVTHTHTHTTHTHTHVTRTHTHTHVTHTHTCTRTPTTSIGTIDLVSYTIRNKYTPLKADHPERPTITLVGHLRIHEAFLRMMCCFLILWSADLGGIAIEVCLHVPNTGFTFMYGFYHHFNNIHFKQ